jgi:HAD superfamily hydrolase (TIGR01450 family)
MSRLIDVYDVALLDLDGTVYVGPHPVVHAVESLNAAVEHGVRTVYTTNNAARTPDEVMGQLRDMGLTLDIADVLTSAQVAAHRIAEELAEGARVLPVGGPGVATALAAAGLTVVHSAHDLPVAVMQGYGPDVSWRDLAEAAYAIAAGARHFATNTDLSIPTGRGIAPGNGTLVAAVVAATGVQPVVTGKPNRAMFDLAVEQSHASRALVVGDRLDTDIEGGTNADLDTLFVFTGVDRVADVLAAVAVQRPTHIARDLRALFDEIATPQIAANGSATCGGWQFSATGAVTTRGDHAIDGVRAAAALAWRAADAGTPLDTEALARSFDL